MLDFRNEIERVLRPRFPALSDESIRNHAEAITVVAILAMVEDSVFATSGAGPDDICIEYSWRII